MVHHADLNDKTVHEYLSRCSSRQLQSVIDAAQCIQHNRGDNVQALSHKVVKKRSPASEDDGTMTVKMLKPLNAFMAFRSYYSPLFQTEQQKTVSGIVKQLWAEDVAQGKWQLVAKAYSTIRDKCGKDFAPLAAYLHIACPAIGIIEPQKYLEAFGWAIVDTEDGKSIMRTSPPNRAAIEASESNTIHSPDDIISICQQAGYMPEGNYDNRTDIQQSSSNVQMTMAVQPTLNIQAYPSIPSANVSNYDNVHPSLVPADANDYTTTSFTQGIGSMQHQSMIPSSASEITQLSMSSPYQASPAPVQTSSPTMVADPTPPTQPIPLQSLAEEPDLLPASDVAVDEAWTNAYLADFDLARAPLDCSAAQFWSNGAEDAVDMAFIPYPSDFNVDPQSFNFQTAFDICTYVADESTGNQFGSGALSLIL